MSEGWKCPDCSRVWAPHVAACGACNQLVGVAETFTFKPLLPRHDTPAAPTAYYHWGIH